MHIFFSVYFDNLRYSLHSYIRNQACAIVEAGHQCTVLCQPGNFADSIQKICATVLITDYEDLDASLQLVLEDTPQFTHVHAYPGKSRIIGIKVARLFKIPFLITFHNYSHDSIESYAQEVDILITINSAIKNYFAAKKLFPPERIMVLPEGVTTNIQYPEEIHSEHTVENISQYTKFLNSLQKSDRLISFVSQFTEDDRYAFDIIHETWDLQIANQLSDIIWIVVGNGPLRPEIEKKSHEINNEAGRHIIFLSDTLSQEELAALYKSNHVCIASGHHVIESLAYGSVTIAISKNHYFGLIGSQNILSGISSNYIEEGPEEDEYETGTLIREIAGIIYDDSALHRLKALSKEITKAFYDQKQIDRKLLQIYRITQAGEPRNTCVSYCWAVEKRALLSFTPVDSGNSLSAHWYYPEDNEKVQLSVEHNGSVRITHFGTTQDFFYLTSASGGFHIPPPDHEDWRIQEGFNYQLQVPITSISGNLAVRVWVIEYDHQSRQSATIQHLHNGLNSIYFLPSEGSSRFRIAIRCSGKGISLISPLSLWREDYTISTGVKPDISLSTNTVQREKQAVERRGDMAPTLLKKQNKVEISPSPDSGHTFNQINIPSPTISVDLQQVSLCYRRSAVFFLTRNKRMRESRDHWAIRDLSLTIYEDDTIGLIGRNGSGKSTTSMLISGALSPDEGTVTTRGRVQLLALGVGFRPQLTGRENVMISGTILGMSRKDVKEKMDEIEAFAELGDFFDEPLRTYSAGMKSRLGFAVSTAVRPDILILDEVMSTGDAAFRNKANKRMAEMRERTKTVVIVSHSPAQIKQLCSRVVWLEQGRLLMDGSPDEILPIYERFCNNPDQWLQENPETASLLVA